MRRMQHVCQPGCQWQGARTCLASRVGQAPTSLLGSCSRSRRRMLQMIKSTLFNKHVHTAKRKVHTAEVGVADVHVHAAKVANRVRIRRGGSLEIPADVNTLISGRIPGYSVVCLRTKARNHSMGLCVRDRASNHQSIESRVATCRRT